MLSRLRETNPGSGERFLLGKSWTEVLNCRWISGAVMIYPTHSELLASPDFF